MEVKYEIKTYEIDYLCPRCQTGHLRPFGNPDGRDQEHRCNAACNYREVIRDKRYPYRQSERVLIGPTK